MRWAFTRKVLPNIPSAYVLMKRKKAFQQARSIIQYHAFFVYKLLRATGRVMSELTTLVIGEQCWNVPSAALLINKLESWNDVMAKNFDLIGRSADVRLSAHADDLVGFFPSMSQQQMISSAQWLIDSYIALKNKSLDQLTISVSVGTNRPAFAGRMKFNEHNQRPFLLEYLLPVCEFSIEASIVVVDNQVYRQIRGGTIGSPLSPPWLIATICHAEKNWIDSLQAPLSLRGTTWECIRYADNRYVMSLIVNGIRCAPDSLFREDFYGGSVVLEPEDKSKLVGSQIFKIDGPLRCPRFEARYVVDGFPASYTLNISDEEAFKYRTPTAAATKSNLMSAFVGRLHLAWRLSFPLVRKKQATVRVIFVYVMMKYPKQWIRQKTSKFLRKHLEAASLAWARHLADCVSNNDWSTLHALGGS